VTENISWRIVSARWPYALGIPLLFCGALISTIALAIPPRIYSSFVTGIVMVVLGIWIIWSTRRQSSQNLSALAVATIKVQSEAPQPGDALNCTLTVSPTRAVRIYEWSISVSLVEPETEEDETYWSEIEATEYRHSFSQPQIMPVGQITEFTGSVDMPGLRWKTAEGENTSYVSWLRIEVRTNLYPGRLQSATIKLTTPAGTK